MKISVTDFKGMQPKISSVALPKANSQLSNNVFYGSGSLVPIKEAAVEQLVDPTKTYKTIYKFDTTASTYKWLYWENDVELARDPIYKDTYNRTCITGLSDVPRIADTVTLGGATEITTSNSYKLGLAIPGTPTLTIGGSGTGTAESRAYVIAYSRKWTDGKIDDGAWSNPAVNTSGGALYIDVLTGQTVSVGSIPDAPTGYGITDINIYRSATGTTTAQFQLVTSFNIALAKAGSVAGVTWNSGTGMFTYVDSILSINLGATAFNQLWIAPPATMRGIISMNNGVLAGFANNYVYFCEPYQCHAWPDKYRVAIDKNVIGLGSFGNTLVICTDGEPYLISMSAPASAVAYPIKENAPCVAGSGIVSFRDGVMYPSYNGFMVINSNGIANTTQTIADSVNISDFNIESMRSAGMDTTYYGAYIDKNNQHKILILDMLHPEYGFSICDSPCTAIYADRMQSTLYVVRSFSSSKQAIAKYNKTTTPLKMQWRSKRFATDDDTISMSAARVRFGSGATSTFQTYTDEDLNNSINNRPFNYGAINGPTDLSTTEVVFNFYVDGTMVFSKAVTSSSAFRLPAGKVGHYFEFEVASTSPIYEVDVATSMKDLFTEDPYALELLK